MTNAYRTAPGLNITNRSAALADSIQPIDIMVPAFVKVYFIGADLLVLQVVRPGTNMSTINLDFAFSAGKQNTVGLIACHRNTAGIFIGKYLVILTVGRDDFNRAAVVHTHTPLGDVEVVCAPVGHPAAAKAAVMAPIRKAVPA